MTEQSDNPGLESLREQIDKLDERVLALLNQRAKVSLEIGKIKIANNKPVQVRDREQQVIDEVRKLNKGPLPDSRVEVIWQELMRACRDLQQQARQKPE